MQGAKALRSQSSLFTSVFASPQAKEIHYLSRYIIQTKADYYRLVQAVRTDNSWEAWILYLPDGIAQTAVSTIQLVGNIKALMQQYKTKLKCDLPKLYSQDLLNNLFTFPYTKIEYLERDLSVSRNTANRYLEALSAAGMVRKQKIGRDNFFINEPLFALLADPNS